MPIPAGRPKTFEELLEEEMSKGTGAGGIIAPAMQRQDDTASNKREFLKKKSSALPPAKRPNSRYKYYADRFGGAKQEASEPQVEERQPKKYSRPPSVREEKPASNLTRRTPAQAPAQNLQVPSKPTFAEWTEPQNEEKSPLPGTSGEEKKPRKFLVRGQGKGCGGAQANRVSSS